VISLPTFLSHRAGTPTVADVGQCAIRVGTLAQVPLTTVKFSYGHLLTSNVPLLDFSKTGFRLQTYPAFLTRAEPLLAAAVYAHPSKQLPVEELLHLPELFPFEMDDALQLVRMSGYFELLSSGLDRTYVRVKT